MPPWLLQSADEANVRGHARRRRDARIGGRHGVRRDRGPGGGAAPDRGVLPRRVVRRQRVRRRVGHGAPGGAARAACGRAAAGLPPGRSSRCSTTSPGRCATRRSAAWARRRPPRSRARSRAGSSTSTPSGPGHDQHRHVAHLHRAAGASVAGPQGAPSSGGPTVELSIDGTPVAVPAGSTILEAARSVGIDTPTLCDPESLTPVDVCECMSRSPDRACSSRPARGASRPGWRSRPTASAFGTPGAWCWSCSGSRRPVARRSVRSDGDLARYATQYEADATHFGRSKT